MKTLESLNVFIGSAAIRWSEHITGDKLLLDSNNVNNKNILSPKSFPTKESDEIKSYNYRFNQLQKNYKGYIEMEKDNMEYWDLFSKVSSEMEKYNHINIIVASGGLFGCTFAPIVLNYIENFQSANIYIQKTNFKFSIANECLLINYIDKYFCIKPIIIEIENIHQKFKDITLDIVLSKLDDLVIKQLSTESVNRNLNKKIKDKKCPSKEFQAKIIEAKHRITRKGNPFGILSLRIENETEVFFMFNEEYTKFKDYYIEGKHILVKGIIQKDKWILKTEAYFKIKSIDWIN